MTRFRRPLAALGALTLAAAMAFGSAGSASAATAPALTDDPAQAAASWLASQLVGADGTPSTSGDHFVYPGGTYFFDGLTADGVYALAAAGVGKAKIGAILDYYENNIALASSVNDTSGAPGPYDGSVAKAALAAIVAGRDATHFGGYNLLQALQDDACTAVSAPANDNDFTTPTCPGVGAGRNIFSSVSQSVILIALKRGGITPTAAQAAFLLSLQCPDGGFTSTTSSANCSSDVDATGFAMLALTAIGGHTSDVDKAANWLLGQRKTGGYWVSQGAANTDSTGVAISALDAIGKDVSTSRDWLASQQVVDGPTFGAGASRGAISFLGEFDSFDSLKPTADAILGLVPGASLLTVSAADAATALPVMQADGDAKHGTVAQGGKQSVAGVGFTAGEKVKATLHSTPVALGTVTAGTDGVAVITFTVPKTLAAGSHTVTLTGSTSGLTATVPFTVTKAASSGSGSTGSGSTGSGSTGSGSTGSGSTGSGSSGTSASGGAELANTGTDLQELSVTSGTALLLLLAGAGLILAGRRRTA